MEKVSHLGSYTGTGASIEITEPGFQPNYICIWNDTDDDVRFEFFGNQTAGRMIKLVNAGTFTPAALTLTGSTPTFTGTAPYTARTLAVTYDAAPGGNKVYLKYSANGAYLACNMATDTVNKVLAFSSDKLMIMHDASAATLGHEIMCTDAGVLQCNNTMTGADEFIRLVGGALLKIAHNASPGTQSVYYDDGADERLECAFGDVTSHNVSTETQGWKTTTPAGTNAQVTVTGNSAGAVSGNITEVTSGGITVGVRGFTIGTDSSINESAKVYRYLAIR